MKVFYVVTIMSIASLCFSKEVPVKLKCLGLEEKKYHDQKNTGALYHLNQSLISFFGENPGTIFNDQSFKNSCPDIPSFYFIKSMLTKPSQYIVTKNSSGEGKDPKYENQIKFNLLGQLLTFLTKTQQNNDQINCLEDKSPSYKKVKFQLYYLQENINKFDELIPKNLVSGLYEDLTKISITGDCSIPRGL